MKTLDEAYEADVAAVKGANHCNKLRQDVELEHKKAQERAGAARGELLSTMVRHRVDVVVGKDEVIMLKHSDHLDNPYLEFYTDKSIHITGKDQEGDPT